MATITITIPDDKVNAGAEAYGFQLPEGGTATAAVKLAFIKNGIIESVKTQFRNSEQRKAREAAMIAANNSTTDVGGIE